MNAWAYLVVSSDGQADTLESQRAWAEATAREHAWTLERTFEGVSTGKYGVRALMESLLGELRQTPKARRPARVLMVRLDRTGRGNAIDTIAAMAEIRNLGVTIHTRVDGDVRLNTVTDSIGPILKSIQAGLENEARSDRARAGHERKRREGKHAGHFPYGVALVGGKPEPYEPEAAVVRALFDRRLKGWGTHRLARYASTVAPLKRCADAPRKMKWGENSVARMLACRTYRGVVVPEDLFDAVQGVRNRPIDRTPKYPWPLRGALKCTCGLRLSSAKSGPVRARTRYYYCRNVAAHQERYPFHRADRLEAQFVELLERLRVDRDFLFRHRDVNADGRRESLETAIADVRRRKAKAWTLFEDDQVPASEVRNRIADLSAEEERLRTDLDAIEIEAARSNAAARAQRSAATLLEEIAANWTEIDVAHQREVALAVSDLVGGLWVAPSAARNASASRIIPGCDL